MQLSSNPFSPAIPTILYMTATSLMVVTHPSPYSPPIVTFYESRPLRKFSRSPFSLCRRLFTLQLATSEWLDRLNVRIYFYAAIEDGEEVVISCVRMWRIERGLKILHGSDSSPLYPEQDVGMMWGWSAGNLTAWVMSSNFHYLKKKKKKGKRGSFKISRRHFKILILFTI